MGSNGHLLKKKKRKIIDVSAGRKCFCLFFKVFHRQRSRKKGVDESWREEECYGM